MSKPKQYNYQNLKPKDKTSGSVTLTLQNKQGPIGPKPPFHPKQPTIRELVLEIRDRLETVIKLNNLRTK
jgi:hypothetical protein